MPETGNRLIGSADPVRIMEILAEIWGREHGVEMQIVPSSSKSTKGSGA